MPVVLFGDSTWLQDVREAVRLERYYREGEFPDLIVRAYAQWQPFVGAASGALGSPAGPPGTQTAIMSPPRQRALPASGVGSTVPNQPMWQQDP